MEAPTTEVPAKPCPFCGAYPTCFDLHGVFEVACQNKKCPVQPSTSIYSDRKGGPPPKHSRSPQAAADAWNARAEAV